MTIKISRAQLLKLIEKYGTSSPQVAKYFIVDEALAKPFSPGVRVNDDLVDIPAATVAGVVGGIAAQNALLLNFANDIAREDRRRRYAKRKKDNPGEMRIVSEGDSWTQYPILLDDLVDVLMKKYNIRSLDAAGDTLDHMTTQGEYYWAIRDEQPRFFLISAGGNDIIGDGTGAKSLATHLKPFFAGATAETLLLPSYDEVIIKGLEAKYLGVISNALNIGPAVMQVIVHGYDHAVPGTGNDWITRNMKARNIADLDLQWSIVKLLINKFNAMLSALPARYLGKVIYADLRGSVAPLEATMAVAGPKWTDELHPKNPGFASAASRIDALITANLP